MTRHSPTRAEGGPWTNLKTRETAACVSRACAYVAPCLLLQCLADAAGGVGRTLDLDAARGEGRSKDVKDTHPERATMTHTS
jgi:hypothetical protein